MSTATLAPPDVLEPFAESRPPSKNGELVWELAAAYPRQGEWDDRDFFALTEDAADRAELVDGRLEFLPVPTRLHQTLMDWLVARLNTHLGRGYAVSSGYKLRIRERVPRLRNDYRDADVLATTDLSTFGPKFATAASLVIEVISPDPRDRERDLVEKRLDYAEAGVPEYWVVDPEAKTVLPLRLEGDAYADAEPVGVGAMLASTAVPGFEVSLAELFDA